MNYYNNIPNLNVAYPAFLSLTVITSIPPEIHHMLPSSFPSLASSPYQQSKRLEFYISSPHKSLQKAGRLILFDI